MNVERREERAVKENNGRYQPEFQEVEWVHSLENSDLLNKDL